MADFAFLRRGCPIMTVQANGHGRHMGGARLITLADVVMASLTGRTLFNMELVIEKDFPFDRRPTLRVIGIAMALAARFIIGNIMAFAAPIHRRQQDILGPAAAIDGGMAIEANQTSLGHVPHMRENDITGGSGQGGRGIFSRHHNRQAERRHQRHQISIYLHHSIPLPMRSPREKSLLIRRLTRTSRLFTAFRRYCPSSRVVSPCPARHRIPKPPA